ncbi:MAG: serine/threonine protein kinase [Gemmataceae bacterium]
MRAAFPNPAPTKLQWDEAYSVASGADTSAPGVSVPTKEALLSSDDRQLGPYRLREQIGEDGMGWIYRAKDLNRRKQYVVKVIKPGVATEGDTWRRFWADVTTLARLTDPRVAAHDVGADRGLTYMSMELVTGESLKARMKRGQLPLPEILWLAREAALALAATHAARLIHGELQPANLWLEPAEPGATGSDVAPTAALGWGGTPVAGAPYRLKVLAPGLMRMDCDSAGRIRREFSAGSSAYRAPEWTAESSGDARSDLFSLGVVLFELATGRPPFPDSSLRDVMASFASASAPLASQYNPRLPRDLVVLIQKLLSRVPSGRPRDAVEVAATLRAIETDLSGRTKKPLWLRWLFVAMPAIMVALCIATAAAFWFNQPAKPPEEVVVPEDKILTPHEALGRVGERVTVEFTIKSAARGRNGGLYLSVTQPDAKDFRAVLSEEVYRELYRRGIGGSELLAGVKVRANGPVILDDGHTVLQISAVDMFEKPQSRHHSN